MNTKKLRICFAIVFVLLTALEVVIALFVHDRFVRPYLGDVIVVVAIWAAVRILFPTGIRLMPLYLFAFSVCVEIGQYFRIVDLIGLGNIAFFRVLMGTSFSFIDIICYAAGALICAAAEAIIYRKLPNNRKDKVK